MTSAMKPRELGGNMPELRELADRMFPRAAGAPLIGENHVRLLEDACENYPAWLAAVRGARPTAKAQP